MPKTAIITLIIIIILLGGYFILRAPAQDPNMEDVILDEEGVNMEDVVEQEFEERQLNKDNEEGVIEDEVKEHIVVYTNSGYSPSSLSIRLGDSVIFRNQGSAVMWPASALHPTHAEYPTTGGCLGSTFDACKGIQPADEWSFRFDIAGNWRYHDHLTPTFFGSITVQE